jgi:multiple sugar transport system substrate-binding protein
VSFTDNMGENMRRHARSTVLSALLAGALALTACGGGSGFDDDGPTADPGENGDTGTEEAGEEAGGGITVLIGSSGDSETDAVTSAVAAWSEESGTEARVQVASDLNQELSQGFAANNPPDVFYVSTDLLAGYVEAGSLEPYGDQLSNIDDFYESLRDNFTLDDTFYCAPKDFSTLALVINTDAWEEAGLTDDDIPTDWDGLEAAAEALTTDSQVGLSFGPEYQRLGVFMAQAGGGLVNDDGTEAIADSPENVEALTFVQQMLQDGILAFPSDIGTGWGGEAFGSGAAAMTIEGNWINGALQADFPDVNYTVVELPEGPAGSGTMQFTVCWGIAADSPNQDDAVALVEYLTSRESQADFAEAFGVMPSVESAREDFVSFYPEQQAFVAGADYAFGPPTEQGANDVIGDFNGQIEGLATGDPQSILSSVQSNMQAVLDAES